MHIDPQTIDPTAVYKLLISSVVPRPIAWVSSLDGAGVANLAPFSYFMAITAEPPTIAFSCSPREGGKKDTLRNVESSAALTRLKTTNPAIGQRATSIKGSSRLSVPAAILATKKMMKPNKKTSAPCK